MSVWQWFTLAKTETYRIHGNIRPRSIFAPVALDACRRANLRLGEFETIFIDFYRLCIPVLIKISLSLILWRWGRNLGEKKPRGEKKWYTASNAVWRWRGSIECTCDHFEAKSTNTKIFSFFLVYIWNCVWPYNP